MREKMEELHNMRELYKNNIKYIESIESEVKKILFMSDAKKSIINNILKETKKEINDLKKDIEKQLDSFII